MRFFLYSKAVSNHIKTSMKLTIRTLLVSTILLTISQSLWAQTPSYEWTQTIGNSDFQYGFDIVTDVNGNTLTTGYFQGTLDFDPGGGVFNLTSAGGYDVFVLKLDTDGNLIWAKNMGGTNNDYGHAIDTDANGNVFITGRFQGTADFDPGAGTTNLTSAGGNDIYVLKLDQNGNLDWVKQMGSTGTDHGRGITVDGNNNVITTGFFEDVVDFDPNAGTTTITSSGARDFFVQKLDNTGNFLWAHGIGGNSSEEGLAITVDNTNAIYTTGYYASFTDFDPGAGTAFSNIQGAKDIFIQKLDANGNYVWHKVMGSNTNDEAYGIATDNSNNVYTTGYFQNTMDIDPGTGTESITSTGSFDAFIQKLDVNGNYIWGKHFGGTSLDYCNSIDTDDNGNVYTTGLFYSTSDFDPGPGTENGTSLGTGDIFIHSLFSNGDFAWVQLLSGNGFNEGRSISVPNNSTIYTTGTFQQGIDFDPGTGTDNRSAVSGNDMFVHKMTQCAVDHVTEVISSCGPYTWSDGNTYNSSTNTPTQTLTNINGCDSIVTLNLTVGQPNSGTDVQTACGSYIWIDGNTYTSSNNTATWTLTNASGCDSVVTLNLTIGQANTGTDIQVACNSYTWIDGITYTASNNVATFTLTNAAGCDSVVTLDLTINSSNSGSETITACESYTWSANSTTYTTSGIYTALLTNVNGCDSTATLNLTINNASSGSETITACESYTWSANSTTYTTSGIYTAVLTNVNGCDSTATLNLTINNASSGSETISACENYTWSANSTTYTTSGIYTAVLTNVNGCDSTATLNLTINNANSGSETITACESYTWSANSTTYTTSGIYTAVLTNVNGCDSTATLNLTINNVSDNSTSLNGTTITASNANATYVWLDCDDNYTVIAGETGQSYTPTSNGNYAVELTEDGCTDTSACVAITTVEIIENLISETITLYPNPTEGAFSIQLGTTQTIIEMKIMNLSGKLIETLEYKNVDSIKHEFHQPKGVYLIELTNDSGQRSLIRLIKQ